MRLEKGHPWLVYVVYLVLLAANGVFFTKNADAQSYLYQLSGFPTGVSPAGVTVADFNRDGRPDLAVSNFSDNTVSILLGNRQGTFGTKVDFEVGNSPAAIVAADFNGDGKLDLATVDENGNTVSVLLGNGDGTFQTHVDLTVGTTPVALVAADFNSDKKLDLAILNLNDGTVSVLLGEGNGQFQSQTVVAVGTGAASLASADFNGDGKLDLITSNAQGAGTVTVLLSNGNGSFTRVDSPSASFSGPLAVGDFNGDGNVDVAVITELGGQLYLLAGKGNGSFEPPQAVANVPSVNVMLIVAGDFNNDKKLDLLVGASFVLLGNGNGTFQSAITFPRADFTSGATAADLNGDGHLDFALINGSLNTVDVYMGNGRGTFGGMQSITFSPTTYGPEAGVAADFNGDGKLDLAIAETNFPNGQISVELGKGNGTFALPIVSPLLSQALNNGQVMLAGDFNADGKIDLLVEDDYQLGFQVLLGNGNGSFQTAKDTTVSSAIGSLAVGDFNRDGNTDVIAVVGNGSTAAVYLSHGDGTFGAGAQYSLGFYSYVVVGDVNNDGKLDFVALSFGQPMSVFLGNGDGTFQSPIPGPTAEYSGGRVLGDFNHDGKLDLVSGTYNGVAFLAGNGDGTYQQPVYSNPLSSLGFKTAAGNLTGKGKLDLVTFASSGAAVMPGNGDGTFQPPIDYGQTGPWPMDLVVGDFNSDGTDDFGMPNMNFNTGATVTSLYLSMPVTGLFPTTINFGTIAVGKSSQAKTVTLTNNGNSSLRIGTTSVTGDFTMQNKCSRQLGIGRNCLVQITFTPTQKGVRTGKLTINDNATGGSQLVSLTGTGD